ncbi:MAG TPA: peptidylprolyl isomerase [Verrucomicrobiae bacterium]|nr:peptidylprolyl isomerase [Verrucomicrobiae bacterium]
MKNQFMIRWFVVIAASAVCAAPLVRGADIRVVEEIAAKVNGDIITKGDLEDKRKEIERTLREENHLSGPALQSALRDADKDILANLISERLLVQRAKDLDINVDADVNRQLTKMQLEQHIPDTEKFHDFIHEQLGISFEDYKLKLAESIMTRKVISGEVGSRINIPEADEKKYYDEHPQEFTHKASVILSQIFISTEGKNPEQVAEAEKTAKDVAARANKGEKFTDLVAKYSDDAATNKEGGVMGEFQPDQLRDDLRKIVNATKKNMVTDPIREPGGFRIIKVNDRLEEGLQPFDEVKDDIQEILSGPLMQPKVQEFLNKLRREAFLEIKDGYIDTQAAPGKDTRWHEVATIKAQTVTKEEVASQRRRKRFLGVFPYGRPQAPKPVDTTPPGEQKTTPAATPATPDKSGTGGGTS